jgi:(p)ppGpp synthase/HD superfamily hydrolase
MSPLPPSEQRARDFAILHHGDQKYGTEPYVAHLDEVAAVLREMGADAVTMQAAYLHDLIEDVKDVTREILALEFSHEVADLVWAVSGEGANRRERVASVFPKLLACPRAVDLKLADRVVNGRRSRDNSPDKFRMYKKEHGAFFLQLNHLGDPRLWAILAELFSENQPS